MKIYTGSSGCNSLRHPLTIKLYQKLKKNETCTHMLCQVIPLWRKGCISTYTPYASFFFLRLDEGLSRGNEIKFKNKVWGWAGGLELQVPVQLSVCAPHKYRFIPIIWEMWGASAESGGAAAMAKRESYEGGGSKGKGRVGGSVLKLGCGWVLGLGNGV